MRHKWGKGGIKSLSYPNHHRKGFLELMPFWLWDWSKDKYLQNNAEVCKKRFVIYFCKYFRHEVGLGDKKMVRPPLIVGEVVILDRHTKQKDKRWIFPSFRCLWRPRIADVVQKST